jgi:alpha-galactosidase
MNYNSPMGSLSNFTPANITMSLDMNSQMYIEYGTMRQIKSSMQQRAGARKSDFALLSEAIEQKKVKKLQLMVNLHNKN